MDNDKLKSNRKSGRKGEAKEINKHENKQENREKKIFTEDNKKSKKNIMKGDDEMQNRII